MRVPPFAVRLPGLLILASCAGILAVAGRANGGPPDPPLEAPVCAVEQDPVTGDEWIGTLGAGLVRNSAGRLDRFTQFNSGLAGDELLDVKLWEGRIFAATTRGISGYDPRTGAWTLNLERRGDVAPVGLSLIAVATRDDGSTPQNEAASIAVNERHSGANWGECRQSLPLTPVMYWRYELSTLSVGRSTPRNRWASRVGGAEN